MVCTLPLLIDKELIEEMNNENGDDADNGMLMVKMMMTMLC